MSYEIRKQREWLARFLVQSAEEEESSIYGISVLAKNQEQLDIFGSDRRRVEEILDILIQDTQKHQKLLAKAADLVIKKMTEP